MGRAWGAIREDETAAEMMGVNTVRTKLLAFAWARVRRRGRARSRRRTWRHDVGLLPVLDLDPRPDHGHPRRHREHLGRARRGDSLVYIDKTLLHLARPAHRQRGPGAPEPVQFNFLIFRHPARGDDAVPAGGLPPSRQRAAGAHRPRAQQEAEAELGVEIETDNIEIAPAAEAELSTAGRRRPGEMEDHGPPATINVGLTGASPTTRSWSAPAASRSASVACWRSTTSTSTSRDGRSCR